MAKGNRGGKRSSKRYSYPGEDLSKRTLIADLDPQRTTNNYIEMDRVNKSGDKVVVKVSDEHLLPTKYGYALILDDKNVVFLKDFNVNRNYYGNEVLLTKQYWNVKQWGDFSDRFSSNPKNLSFDEWVKTAKTQQKAGNLVKWEDKYKSPKTRAILKRKG